MKANTIPFLTLVSIVLHHQYLIYHVIHPNHMLDCWTGIEFLRVMQDLRLSLPDIISDIFVWISSPAVYMAIPIMAMAVMFWFVSKRSGEFCMLNVVMAYNLMNLIKFAVRQPRPWVLDPEIHPAEGSADHATGYSFPSGHSAIAVAGYGSLAVIADDRRIRAVLSAVAIAILFARLYLCVHTPIDVLFGAAMSVGVMVMNKMLLQISYRDEESYRVVSAIYILIAVCVSAGILILSDTDQRNMMIGIGFLCGVSIGRVIEHRCVRYEIPEIRPRTKAVSSAAGLIIAAVLIAVPMMFGDIGAGIGAFLAVIWMYDVFPHIMMVHFRG